MLREAKFEEPAERQDHTNALKNSDQNTVDNVIKKEVWSRVAMKPQPEWTHPIFL